MPTPALSVDEIIATINRSTLPSLIVEGKSDKALLRHLVDKIGLEGSTIFCDGRNNLFKLAERRGETCSTRLALLADQDLYCIEGNHFQQENVVYTWGYSIENDVLAGSHVEKLIANDEKEELKRLKLLVAKFFAREYEIAKQSGLSPNWSTSLDSIIDRKHFKFKKLLSNSDEIHSYDTAFSRRLHRDLKRLLRGKQLVELYLYLLNRPGRSPRMRMNGTALLLCCSTLGKNPRLEFLIKQIRQKLLN